MVYSSGSQTMVHVPLVVYKKTYLGLPDIKQNNSKCKRSSSKYHKPYFNSH